jgi:hypothetical protein
MNFKRPRLSLAVLQKQDTRGWRLNLLRFRQADHLPGPTACQRITNAVQPTQTFYEINPPRSQSPDSPSAMTRITGSITRVV